MKPATQGYRVAVLGADSLLGKEILTVLEERRFPVARLVTLESPEAEPDLPIVDLRGDSEAAIEARDITEQELDFAFLASRPPQMPPFLSFMDDAAAAPSAPPLRHCRVIDLIGQAFGGASRPEPPEARSLRVPFLDSQFGVWPAAPPSEPGSRYYVSPHPAAILLTSLLLRLSARFPVVSSVAQVFSSASEIGPRAIEELQKQTVSLLSFQKIPRAVFGAQLAFNVLPRVGPGLPAALSGLEARLRRQLREYLGRRVPLPALRLLHMPVFHSLALSLYVETSAPVSPHEVEAALAGGRMVLRHASQDAPSQVDVAGSDEIRIDSITPDAEHRNGLWLWAVADNLRLAALNAVEIAESLQSQAWE